MNENVKIKAETILKNFQEGKSSEEEEKILRNWLAKKSTEKESIALGSKEKAELLSKINIEIDKERRSDFRIRVWKYAGVAAILVACLGVLFYFTTTRDIPTPTLAEVAETSEILPGTDEAILELPDGRKIGLNPNNVLLQEVDGVKVNISTGVISFEGVKPREIPSDKIQETIIKTKNGGQYTVVLPDGTIAKLNANSSLSFASNFQNKRFAKVIGEVYFDVKRDEQHTFIIDAGHQSIKILGTKFNIKSYPEEQITMTSLISGSLSVRSNNSSNGKYHLLKPGETAKNGSNLNLTIYETLPAKEMAWADGSFYFDGETIQEVLTVLARWYDIQVKYEYTPSDDMRFGGIISRDRKLSSVLSLLEDQTGLKILLRGREVIVQK